jgi:hypothetical protein
MRKNAAMQAGPDTHRASAASLLPIAVVAAAVVVLALLVHGGRKGTIVVERETFVAMTVQNGKTNHPAPFVITSIDETSADGALQRSFTSNSITRPGYQEVDVGAALQLYDPADNTVYVTTQQAQQRAIVAQVLNTAPQGSYVGVGTGQLSSVGYSSATLQYVPGRVSIFERQLAAGQFRLAARTTIDGRAALKLVQTRPTVLPVAQNAGSFMSRDTVYVAPGTYDPIEGITRSTLPGLRTTVVIRWLSYKVLPATPGSRRLLSLTARHPTARVVDNARAYVGASQSEIRTTTTP